MSCPWENGVRSELTGSRTDGWILGQLNGHTTGQMDRSTDRAKFIGPKKTSLLFLYFLKKGSQVPAQFCVSAKE